MAEPAERIDPVIHICDYNSEIRVVPENGGPWFTQRAFVVRQQNPGQAYALVPGAECKELRHGGPVWGYLFIGYILPYNPGSMLFEHPTEETVQRVAIKILYKSVVDSERERGSAEDPYREIYRMQTIGDNHHVLGCIEALCDENFLYIISPYCEQKTLAERLPLPEREAREVFAQMLEAVSYLHERNICHADIDPGNFFVKGDGRVLLGDLAMSFLIPPDGSVKHNRLFGKHPYWAPELCVKMRDPTTGDVATIYSAQRRDLWACMATLFNLLTGENFCELPSWIDKKFNYCIQARALSNNPEMNLVQAALQDAGEVNLDLSTLSQQILNMRPELLELFGNALAMNPDVRWTINEMQNCTWMTMALP